MRQTDIMSLRTELAIRYEDGYYEQLDVIHGVSYIVDAAQRAAKITGLDADDCTRITRFYYQEKAADCPDPQKHIEHTSLCAHCLNIWQNV